MTVNKFMDSQSLAFFLYRILEMHQTTYFIFCYVQLGEMNAGSMATNLSGSLMITSRTVHDSLFIINYATINHNQIIRTLIKTTEMITAKFGLVCIVNEVNHVFYKAQRDWVASIDWGLCSGDFLCSSAFLFNHHASFHIHRKNKG